MAKEKKSLPSSSSQAFEKRGGTVQPRGQARSEAGDSLEPFLDAHGRVRSSLVPTSVHLMVLSPNPESSQLGSSLLPIFFWPGLSEPSRRKRTWPTSAYVPDSLLKPRRRHISQESLNCRSSSSTWMGRAI